MAKIIISLLIPLLVSCSIQNRNARSSVSTMCVDLLSARVAIDTPTPLCINKENYEEGVIYFVSFNDGTMIFHEGALAGFDVDEYTPLGSKKTKKYKIYWGNKDGEWFLL